MLSRPVYRCPACRWHLAFEAVDGEWVAFCWNKPALNPCPVGRVAPVDEHEMEEANDG